MTGYALTMCERMHDRTRTDCANEQNERIYERLYFARCVIRRVVADFCDFYLCVRCDRNGFDAKNPPVHDWHDWIGLVCLHGGSGR